VRECVREGYEWIKTFTTGGRVSGGQEIDSWYVNHTPEEMEAIVDEAHRFGVGVMVHTSTREGIKLAVDAGVDTVEHGWPLDDELIEAMLAKDIALVPTISVYSERGFLRDGVQAELRARAQNQIASRAASFQRAYAAGVRIGHGTDVHPPMPTMRPSEAAFELAMYVRLGMDAMDAVVSATGGAAQILGLQDQLGTLAPGRLADVIAVAGDPLADPSVLERGIRLVVHEGQVHRICSPAGDELRPVTTVAGAEVESALVRKG
jgi:imidazolonepropionase-like amidohydrolase